LSGSFDSSFALSLFYVKELSISKVFNFENLEKIYNLQLIYYESKDAKKSENFVQN